MISTIKLPNKEDLPELLVPPTKILLDPSIKKFNNPAPSGLIVLFSINNGKVQGLSLCLLRAYPSPSGFNGFP